jgi:phosphoribosylanthranilate isomerase
LESAARISGDLQQGLKRVGVFVNEGVERISAIVGTCGLQVAQLHGDEPVADADALRRAVPGLEVWKALRVGDDFDAAGVEVSGFDAVLLDTAARDVYGGTGRTFPWEAARRVGERTRLIVAGGLDASNVAEAVAQARPWGVDASSRLESGPGVKDPEKLRAIGRICSCH